LSDFSTETFPKFRKNYSVIRCTSEVKRFYFEKKIPKTIKMISDIIEISEFEKV
jgi:hypothetical protein